MSDPFGLIGTVLENRYRVDACVGEGGFGVVYRATHTVFAKQVAIKLLKVPAHFVADARASFVRKFVREGQLVAGLSEAHPAVVRILDVGVATLAGLGVPYLALEWLDGQTLDAHVQQRGPLGEAELLELLAPVVDALGKAHAGAAGQVIAHRDIKPQNLFVTTGLGGRRALRVLDFGIAKVMQDGDDATSRATGATSTFTAFSPPFGAPEQFNPDDIGATGPATDVHALGLVVGYALTGRPPYRGKNALQMAMEALGSKRPTPRALGATVSDALEAVCARALAVMPGERYPTAGELGAALRAASREGGATRSAGPPAPTMAAEPVATPKPATVFDVNTFDPRAAAPRPPAAAPPHVPAPQEVPRPRTVPFDAGTPSRRAEPAPKVPDAQPSPDAARAWVSTMIGIDLGTTKCAAAWMRDGVPSLLVNQEGARTTPSVVAYDDAGEVLVGDSALRQRVVNPLRTIGSAARWLGRLWSTGADERRRAPCEVVEDANGYARFGVRGAEVAPAAVLGAVLRKLRNAAEEQLGARVTEAVVTVPACFSLAQRRAVRDAGRIAGLEVKRIVHATTAAALAYGLATRRTELVAVYDFGGGTSHCAIIEVDEMVVQTLAARGEPHLGGDDLDHLIVDWLVEELVADTGLDVLRDKAALARLGDAAERAKIVLSSLKETTIDLPFLTVGGSAPVHLRKQLTRERLERMILPLVERTLESARRALTDARRRADQVDTVLLVGGSTRIPLVRERVRQLFGKEPSQAVNADEAGALGAAIQAGILGGDVKDIVLLEALPWSIGIEADGDGESTPQLPDGGGRTASGESRPMLRRDKTAPCQGKEVFSTTRDGQTSVEIHVVQGDRDDGRHSLTVARVRLDGIRPAVRGEPKIEVVLDVDANEILTGRARDLESGREVLLRVASPGDLGEGELHELVREAEAREAAQRERRERLAARQRLDGLCATVEAAMRDGGPKLGSEVIASMHALLAEGRRAVAGEDDASVARLLARIESEVHRIAKILYS